MKRTTYVLVSDLSGAELTDLHGRTVKFSYEGIDYSIDLTPEEALEFDRAIHRYTSAATKVGGRRRSKPPVVTKI